MPVKGTADSLNRGWSACEDIKYTAPSSREGAFSLPPEAGTFL